MASKKINLGKFCLKTLLIGQNISKRLSKHAKNKLLNLIKKKKIIFQNSCQTCPNYYTIMKSWISNAAKLVGEN